MSETILTPPSDGGTPPPAAAPAAPGTPPAAAPTPAPAGDPPPPAAGDPAPGASGGPPDAYAEFGVPEDGAALDAATLEAFRPVAKELGLSQAAAQKLVDLAARNAKTQMQAAEQAFSAQLAEWAEAVRTDPEIGGPKFDATVRGAADLLRRFGTPELKAALNETGMGNHPELVRFVARLSAAISNDAFVLPGGGGGPTALKSTADVLYGGG